MSKAGFESERISTKTIRQFKDITSVVVSNYGTDPITVMVQGIERPVPPVHETLNVPVAPFRIESYGHGIDVDLIVDFPSGPGNAIIDVIKLKDCSR